MSSINTNVAAMAAVRSLNTISQDMGRTQQSIETGLRIGRANDDPAVFSIAQGMRANLKGLTAVRDGLAFGRSALTVSRDALTNVSNELNSLKQIVTQGQQQGLDPTAVNNDIANRINAIRGRVESATFNGVNLLNNQAPGDRTLSVLRDASGNTINTANQNVISAAGALLNIDNLNVAQGAVRISPPANIAVVDGNFVVVQLNRGSTNVNNPEREIVFEFNADQSATAGNRVLAQQVNGSRQVVEVKIGTGTDMTPQAELGALVNAMKANGIGARVNNDGTLDIMAGGLTGVAYSLTDSAGTPVTHVGGVSRATVAAATWGVSNAAYTAPTGATGIGTMGGAAANSQITVVGGTVDGTDVINASSAISVVDQAITAVNTSLATIGSRLGQIEGQQDFIKQLTDSIKEGLGALVDADLAEESARLTALQTRQQLATQSLSIANQQSQSLLSLFR
jgi:flagellin